MYIKGTKSWLLGSMNENKFWACQFIIFFLGGGGWRGRSIARKNIFSNVFLTLIVRFLQREGTHNFFNGRTTKPPHH